MPRVKGGPEKIDDPRSQTGAPPLPVKNDSSLRWPFSIALKCQDFLHWKGYSTLLEILGLQWKFSTRLSTQKVVVVED